VKRILSVAALALVCFSAAIHAGSFYLAPSSQTTEETCTIHVHAAGLVDAKGLDIEILFDKNIVRCSSVLFARSALPSFSEFRRAIDNESGRVETVLLRTSPGGFTGDADTILILTFEPVASGTSLVRIKKSDPQGNPILIDVDNNGIEAQIDTAAITVTGHETPPVISELKLHQNYPNPFNPTTTITFDVPARSPVSLKIYNVSGTLVRTLIHGRDYEIGSWSVDWNGTNDRGRAVPSGIYLCVLEIRGKTLSRKLVILR
jgi:hypothetical protein